MNNYRFTRTQLEEAANQPDLTINAIADRFNVSHSTINYYLKKWNIKKISSRVAVTIPKEVIEPLWQDPERTIKSVAEELEVSRSRVETAAKKHGLGPKAKIITAFDDTQDALEPSMS